MTVSNAVSNVLHTYTRTNTLHTILQCYMRYSPLTRTKKKETHWLTRALSSGSLSHAHVMQISSLTRELESEICINLLFQPKQLWPTIFLPVPDPDLVVAHMHHDHTHMTTRDSIERARALFTVYYWKGPRDYTWFVKKGFLGSIGKLNASVWFSRYDCKLSFITSWVRTQHASQNFFFYTAPCFFLW